MSVSIRTLYRDIATLQAQGAEIMGEPGIGYILRPGFFLPPLMFTQLEIEALMLGTLWVSQFGDAPLSKAADNVLAKIAAVLPANMRNGMQTYSLRVGPPMQKNLSEEDLSKLREAIRQQRKIQIIYQASGKQRRQKVVWPFTIGYFSNGRILVGWCAEKGQFHHFKTSKIISIEILKDRYNRSQESLFKEWQALQLRNLKR